MTQYNYEAVNENGHQLKGVLEAESEYGANVLLSGRGYIPLKIKARRGTSAKPGARAARGAFFTPVKPRDLILFTQQFRTMIRAGLPMLESLENLQGQTENARLKKVLGIIQRDIKEGKDLYDAFRKHSSVFSPLYCSMIRAGESSGSLPEVLGRLIYIIEHEHKIKSDVKAALRYPMIVLLALVVAFFVLLTFVIPRFVAIFNRAGLALPLPTRICLNLYQFLSSYWPLIILSLLVGIAGLVLYCKTSQGRYVRDYIVMHLPLLGPLFIKAAMSRFAAIFSILQHSGVAVMQSMRILSGTIGNAAIGRQFDRVRDRLEEGRGIAEPLRSSRFFTPMVISMVAIGEDTGNLDELLKEVSAHYDSEVEYAVKQLSDAISPLLTIGLAAMVGFFAMAVFMPMWDLMKIVK